jgi:hypothetical protein
MKRLLTRASPLAFARSLPLLGKSQGALVGAGRESFLVVQEDLVLVHPGSIPFAVVTKTG